jgi:hypothetical protein
MEGRTMVTGGEWKVIALSGGLASLSRLANLLRKGNVTVKKFLQLLGLAILQGGTAGIVVAMLLWERLHDRPLMLIAVSMVAGFGGIELLELLYTFGVAVMKQFAADALKGGKE